MAFPSRSARGAPGDASTRAATWWARARPHAGPLAAVFALFLLVAGSMLLRMPSETYRDEWGYAEFAIAQALDAGALGVRLPAADAPFFAKAQDAQCALGSPLAAVAVSRLTGQPLATVYVYGTWAVLPLPFLAYALLSRVARPWRAALGAAAASTFVIGFPYYLVDPRGLMLCAHALFVLAAWRVAVRPTPARAALAGAAALLSATVYAPFGIVESVALLLLLLLVGAGWKALAAGAAPMGLAALALPACVLPYAHRVLTDLRLPQYPPAYVPHLQSFGLSVQLAVAGAFALLLLVALAGRSMRLASQRLLVASSLAALAFAASSFSIHRFFTFVVLPLALALAESTDGARGRLAPRATLARWIERAPGMGLARRASRRAMRPGIWAALATLLLVLSAATSIAYPSSGLVRYGSFTDDYLDGVDWVAARVPGNFTSDLKFAGAVFALHGKTSGRHVMDNYDETGNLTAMWWSQSADETWRVVVEDHGSTHLVVTRDMERLFIAGDFYRQGAGEKLAQIHADPRFRLVYENPEIRVYAVEPAGERA